MACPGGQLSAEQYRNLGTQTRRNKVKIRIFSNLELEGLSSCTGFDHTSSGFVCTESSVNKLICNESFTCL